MLALTIASCPSCQDGFPRWLSSVCRQVPVHVASCLPEHAQQCAQIAVVGAPII